MKRFYTSIPFSLQLSSAQHAAISTKRPPSRVQTRPSSAPRRHRPPPADPRRDRRRLRKRAFRLVERGGHPRGHPQGARQPGLLRPRAVRLRPESRTFKGTLPSQTGEWHYRAFYPHNGTASVSGSKTTVTVPFSALRTQEGNRYNSEYDLLAADAILYPNAAPA